MKDFFVIDAAKFENQTVTTYFVLTGLSVRDGKRGQYLALTLGDKSGQMEARMWEEFAETLKECTEGCYVKVKGLISMYQGKPQITVNLMRSARESEVETADFVPTTQFDIAEMYAELIGYVDAFQSAPLRELVHAFLDDPEIGEAFKTAPAAKRLHHAWIGGLLEHVLMLVRIIRAIAPFYPEADAELVQTGAILHDIGKVRELSWKNSFNYTLEGQLIGHISIAQGLLHEKVAALNARGGEPFPDKLRLLVEHMILAHHGKLEFGSPKLPMTPEALLLSALDDLEAKFQTMRAEFAGAKAAGKGAGDTTEWVRSMERPLFDSVRYLTGE